MPATQVAGIFFIPNITTFTVQDLHDSDDLAGFDHRLNVHFQQKRAQFARLKSYGYIRSYDERCGHSRNAQ
jgi:hypothetical protein